MKWTKKNQKLKKKDANSEIVYFGRQLVAVSVKLKWSVLIIGMGRWYPAGYVLKLPLQVTRKLDLSLKIEIVTQLHVATSM